jgi:signal transduction histidine kinase
MVEGRNYSIKRKLIWMNMLVSGAALLVASAAFVAYELAAFRQTLVRSLSIQAQMVGSSSASALVFSDPESANKTLSALRAAPNILSGGIYTPAGELFAAYSRNGSGEGLPLHPGSSGQIEAHRFTGQDVMLVRSIVFQGKRIGTVYIRSDLQELKDRLKRYAGIVAIVLLMSLMAAFVLSSVYQRTIARPIVQLAEIARIVSREKNYSVRGPGKYQHGEIAILVEAFNEMLAQIQRREEERKTLLMSEQEARRTAELLNRVGPIVLGELDLKKLAQKVIDLATQLSGAQFGAFARVVVNEDGTSPMLYTFSGALCEAFIEIPQPADSAAFNPKFSEKTIVRSDDITQGAPEGKPPFPFGMPDGSLPVRSYLGVPVISRFGEVMGGLIFGHCSPAMFTERHEQLVLGIAAQAAIAIDNANLFEQVRQGRLRAEETSVVLRRVNSDLEQFAYSAYHDLREPLRMVRIYTQKLEKDYGDKLGPGADLCIRYTVQGASRMEQLVSDLINYTQAGSDNPEPAAPSSAEIAFTSAISSLQEALEKCGASISHERLPQVRMHRAHLEQLFLNLTANAIKYRGEKPPEIRIRAERRQGEWVFSVQDNGIGIDPQYGEQIFGVFKRLHSAEEYSGTGIGLAICRKIVQRYGGRIWVESELRKGATFLFTVPDGEAEAGRG